MKAIKFNEIDYELAGFNITADHLSASLVKGDYTVDDIIADLEGTTKVTISEDGETQSVYNGYTKLFVVTYFKDYEHDEPVDIVSVEFINESLQQQINDLFDTVENVQTAVGNVQSTVEDVQDEQDQQSESLTNLKNQFTIKVDGELPRQINELSNTVEDVQNAQNSQSNTIANLNDRVNRTISSDVIGNVENIGKGSNDHYDVNDKFLGSDGKYYKVTVPIIAGDILVVGGNCEETSISEELKPEE